MHFKDLLSSLVTPNVLDIAGIHFSPSPFLLPLSSKINLTKRRKRDSFVAAVEQGIRLRACGATRPQVQPKKDEQTQHKYLIFISFHFISFHFISFHFISFHFISFHFDFISILFHFLLFVFLPFSYFYDLVSLISDSYQGQIHAPAM